VFFKNLLKKNILQKLLTEFRTTALIAKASLSGFRVSSRQLAPHALTAYSEERVYDLTNLQLRRAICPIHLVAFPFGQGALNSEPVIAAVVVAKGRIEYHSKVFSRETLIEVHRQRDKPCIEINTPVYLMPYNTNHFGHFTGECLGALIYFSEILKDNNRKIQFICPEPISRFVHKHADLRKINQIDSLTLQNNNLVFNDAIVLPRLTAWQNMTLCIDIVRDLPIHKDLKYERIFLTSERLDRIHNLEEVQEFLERKGFQVLNPKNYSFEETLILLRDAELVITEAGSITHNILLSRNKPYHVLVSENAKQMSVAELTGGGVFNMFRIRNARHHYFKPLASGGSHHAYANSIVVDIGRLRAEFGW
jgi:hypothetical protein